MSGPAGNGAQQPGAGRDAKRGGASTALMVVLEPERPGAAATKPALLREGRRVARQLGAAVATLAWQDSPDVDLRSLAHALVTRVSGGLYAAVLLADTTMGREVAPLLASRLGSGAVLGCSDVRVVDGCLRFVKSVYGGWLEQEVHPAAGTTPVVTIDLAGLDSGEAADDEAVAVEVLDLDLSAAAAAAGKPVRRLEVIPPDARSVDLVHAKRIVAAGMGTADEELLSAVHELADLLEGSVGATRPMVDDGRLPKERLIGQTGRTVTPDLYVALGISGSPHHVAGVRKADTIMAVNRDPRAPIFQFADVGYVADLRAVLPALVARIKEWRDAGE